jgi:hypothetical protein
LKSQIDELIKAEVKEHEKVLQNLKEMALTLEEYFHPSEFEVKRVRLDKEVTAENTTVACISQRVQALPWQGSSLKSVAQGIAAQVFQALLRELTSRGRICM